MARGCIIRILQSVILTPSLPWCYLKTTHKSAKFETFKPPPPLFFFFFFFFFALAPGRSFITTHCIESRYVTGPENEYTACRRVPAAFSLEILQAGAVKGLNRLVCKAKKSDHIHPILATLHWLPATHRIQYKISTICFNSISGTAPQYVRSPSTLYSSKTITICIWHTKLCHPPCKHKNVWWKIFSYSGPTVWNNLPQTLRHSDSTSSFKAANNYF